MSDRTVLVTGATGFVGGAVTRVLLKAGYRVHILVRSPERAADLIALGAHPVQGDMCQPDSYRAVAGSVDVVVHAAQRRISGRVTRSKLDRMAQDNAAVTKNLAHACLASGARFLYTSGCYTYGDHGDQWVTEDMPFTPSPLGINHAEQVSWLREHRDRGLDYVVLSLGFVYGPGGNFLRAFYEPARHGLLRCIGPGTNFFSCVHVDDAATAYARALLSARPGEEYLVADDKPLTMRGWVNQITMTLGRRPAGTIPGALAGVVAGQPAVGSLVTSCRVSAAKAHEALGWRPRYSSAAEGIPATISALLSETDKQPARSRPRSNSRQ
jgi:nucleoside-diphosphate-sugar epimerase